MAPSLRKRLSKQSSESLDKNSKKNPSSPFLAAIDHLAKPPTSSNENMDSTPPPPEHLVLPKEPEKARRSPSRSLLERYKGRGPSSSKIPSAASWSESHTTLTSRPKIPALKEKFDRDSKRSPAAAGPQPEVAETSKSDRPTIRTVSGVDFQMVSKTQASSGLQRRGRSAEPAYARSGSSSDGDHENRRTTRSESRRKERADSTTETNDSATIMTESATTKPEYTKTEAPRPRATLKKRSKSQPSDPTRPSLPRSTRSKLYNHQTKSELTTPTKTRVPIDSDMSSDSSSDTSSSSCEFILDSTDSTTAQVGSQGQKKRIPPHTRVLPPIAMPGIISGLVWVSPLSGTSRPLAAWMHSKRWTCCKCAGTTIVEQAVCSRLTCVHRRCGGRCVVDGRSAGVRAFTAL